MPDDDPLQEAADAVADGIVVDWEALSRRVTSQADRQRLDNLRVIAAIKAIDYIRGGGDLPAALPPPPGSTHSDPPQLPRQLQQPRQPRQLEAGHGQGAGESWGRYQLVQEVGAGSFGKVYRAWDPNLERHIAVKILHSSTADIRVRERVLLEGKQLARLRDPNVVEVLDVEEHDGQFGLCMEFVDGETLDQVLRSRGTLNAGEAMLVGQDVCRALAAAHGAGVVHRDVKARNIMRDRSGRIVLMDFGAGREVDELERADPAWSLVGTPLYMAPEVLAGHHATYSSDLYSVGVLLYYLVTGKYPVNGRTLKDIRTAHMFGVREPITHRRTDLPPGFIRIIERALAANPAQRYRSAAEMLDDLVAANLPPAPKPAGRDSVTAAGVALAGVVTGVAAVTLLGAVISRYFNGTMGRADFASEGLSDWFAWGAQSLAMPVVFFAFAVIGVALIVVLHPLAVSVYPGMPRLERRLVDWVHHRDLDSTDHLCRWVLVVSVVLVGGSCWYYADLLNALFIYPDVSSAPAWQLQRLSPAFKPDHFAYRKWFMVVTIACAVMWYVPLRLAAKRQEPVNRVLLTSGVAITLLAVLLFSFPYRMLSDNGNFEVALWQQARCYILGERRDDVLLFCPTLEPRSRVINRAAEGLQRIGTSENPFTLFSPTSLSTHK